MYFRRFRALCSRCFCLYRLWCLRRSLPNRSYYSGINFITIKGTKPLGLVLFYIKGKFAGITCQIKISPKDLTTADEKISALLSLSNYIFSPIYMIQDLMQRDCNKSVSYGIKYFNIYIPSKIWQNRGWIGVPSEFSEDIRKEENI